MTVFGKVGRPHGKHGLVKIIPAQNLAELFFGVPSLCAVSPTGKRCLLTNIRKHTGGRFIGELLGIEERDDAESFKGGLVIEK